MTKGSDTDVWTSDSRPVAASLLRACTSACPNQVVNARFYAIGFVYIRSVPEALLPSKYAAN
jgi:hypothetical protein